jgi:hypothetical protein
MSRPKHTILIAAMSVGIGLIIHGTTVRAEDSQSETPPDELELAQAKGSRPPAEIQEYIAYLLDLDRRYADRTNFDPEQFLAEEGELAALLYCRALGFDGPCAPGDDGRYAPIDPSAATGKEDYYWYWVRNRLYNVGVIPHGASCPAPSQLIVIHMDDEDRRNANASSGWTGATGLGRDTTWRLCKLDGPKSIEFMPYPQVGDRNDYAMWSFGLLCPRGSRRVIRYQDNEDRNNRNYASGDIFPNLNSNDRNWLTTTCHFDGAIPVWPYPWRGWPDIGAGYSVFASADAPFATARGWVFQDDEDNNNRNYWDGNPEAVMYGGRNTHRNIGRVTF